MPHYLRSWARARSAAPGDLKAPRGRRRAAQLVLRSDTALPKVRSAEQSALLRRVARAALVAAVAAALAFGGGLAGWAEEEAAGGAPAAPAQPTEQAPAAGTQPATPAGPGGAAQAPAVEQPAAAPAQPAQETTAPEAPAQPPLPALVAGMQIEGNKQIETKAIEAVIGSAVGAPYSDSQVEADRSAIANLGWFRRVEVDREKVESGMKLVFRVVENPVVTSVKFEGLREMKPEQLLAVMETKPGAVFNWTTWRRDGEAIYKLYRARGFILATLFDPSMTEEGALTVTVAEGVVEDIKIVGNTYTKTYVIRRYIRTKPGDTYNYGKVSSDVIRLTNLDYFDTVSQDAEMGSEPGKVVVVYTVVEKKHTGLASVGGGYSSVQGIVGFLDLSKNNLRGTGQMVAIRGEFGGRTSYEFGYRNPWVMTPETRMSLGVYDRLTVREAFVTTDTGENRGILYDERRSGGNITFGRPLSDRTTLYVGLRSDDVALVDLTAEEQQFLQGAAFQPRRVRSLTLAGVTDNRDNLRNPGRGSYRQLSVELAGVFGGTHFSKYTTDMRHYFPLGRGRVLAMRLLGGTISGDAPYLEQFLLGGTESLRGFRTDRFAGSHMTIFNTEYRWPVSKNLTGVLFVDAGDAWGGSIASDPFFHGDKDFALHLGYGVGVRVQTAIGPLRLDLGFSDEGTETHFGVSHMF